MAKGSLPSCCTQTTRVWAPVSAWTSAAVPSRDGCPDPQPAAASRTAVMTTWTSFRIGTPRSMLQPIGAARHRVVPWREARGGHDKEVRRPFACNTRPETVSEELVGILKEANCVLIAIGMESGDENLREKVLQRRMSDDRIVLAFDIIRKYGIKSASFNMVGIPGETRELFRKTITLNARIHPDLAQQTIFYPYRGTALGDQAHREGYIVRQGYPTYFGRGTLSLPGFPLRQIEREALFFEYNVYKGTDLKRAFRGLAQSYGRRYPIAYQAFKKTLTRLNLWHSGGWHHDADHADDVSVMGSGSRVSTRPTAGVNALPH